MAALDQGLDAERSRSFQPSYTHGGIPAADTVLVMPSALGHIHPKKTLEAFCDECHFECHRSGKTRKRRRMDESRCENSQTLNRWRREA